ncbi:MAG: pyruvate, phosphate dikinase [Fibrobacteres bacterium]|nr:pyruvate, phosphate dikinase [Fibrobacterota bacterium]
MEVRETLRWTTPGSDGKCWTSRPQRGYHGPVGGQISTGGGRKSGPGALSGTKAEVLAKLAEAGFPVPPTVYFSVERWNRDSKSVADEVMAALPMAARLAVRSSCRREDREDSSMAGAFLSRLDIPPPPDPAFAEAVKDVLASYGPLADGSDQILVQPMVENVRMSGVVMTRDLVDGSPYYVVEYDDETGRTDSVTGGAGTISKTVHIFRQFRNTDFDSPRLLQVVRVARQLEGFLASSRLDIEFCTDANDDVHVLQARLIGGSSRWSLSLDEEIVDKISFVEEALAEWNRPPEGIWGGRTILGVMPDWNPAEIVGIHPRPLATSLYRDLVTRRTWSLARSSMGYRSLPPVDLMVQLAGRPYIDVRASFNSFLPEGTDAHTGSALVESWLDRLAAHPEFHDKVEFEVAQTVFDPLFGKQYASRTPGLLPTADFQRWSGLLRQFTIRAFDLSETGGLSRALASARELEHRQALRGVKLPDRPGELLHRAQSLLEECRSLGTLPFAVVARHAFIAESFLRAAVVEGALSPEDLEAFRSGIRTVSVDFSEAIDSVRAGNLAAEDFLARFGHLRPGTYDILSPRYADHPDSLLSGAPPRCSPREATPFTGDLTRLDSLLAERLEGGPDAAGLLAHAERAVAGREWTKFVFTRNLSDALECLALWGEKSGVGREDLSWLCLEDLLGATVAPPLCAPREWLAPALERGRRTSEVGRGLKLGYLIRSPRDVYVMPRHRCAPNFVTRSRLRAKVVHIDGRDFSVEGLAGSVVCVRNADPGFDWLFSRGIGGLVTQFGGTNSHMAIRCAEYGIPAAIGCGEQLFESIRRSPACELDAGGKRLLPLEAT